MNMFIHYMAEYPYDLEPGPFLIFTHEVDWNGIFRCNECVWIVPGTGE
jgi:hypothetical protein